MPGGAREARSLQRERAKELKEDKKKIASKGDEADDTLAGRLIEAGVDGVRVRSATTCEAEYGVCRACYGWSLATGRLVDIGESVGIVAAQSIGEPGTQLTMRTFHIGGTATRRAEQSSAAARAEGEARFVNLRTVEDRQGRNIAANRHDAWDIIPWFCFPVHG